MPSAFISVHPTVYPKVSARSVDELSMAPGNRLASRTAADADLPQQGQSAPVRSNPIGGLRELVRNFDQAGQSGRLIREVAEADWDSFYATAIGILNEEDDGEENRGRRNLVAVILGRGLLLDALCDQRLTRDGATTLVRLARDIDPLTDTYLARALAETSPELGSRSGQIIRLMEILEGISKHGRIPDTFRHILRSEDRHLKSKAVLMLGRSDAGGRWLLKRLGEQDPRIRANAVEALWGVDNAQVRDLLKIAMQDLDNRVAGNALLALYQLGDASAIPNILKMGRDKLPPFRQTAAWVMERTADPRFSEMLGRMLGDPEVRVRGRAFTALARVRSAAAEARRGTQWLLGADVTNEPDGIRRVALEVVAPGGARPAVAGTQIILAEDGRNVTDYEFQEVTHPPRMAVAFILPESSSGHGQSAWNAAALRALEWKPAGDRWTVLPYLTSPSTGGTRVRLETVSTQFAASLDDARAQFDDSRERVYYANAWGALARTEEPGFWPRKAARRLIVVNASASGPVASVIREQQGPAEAGVCIQAISLAHNSALEEVCHSTHGSYVIARDEVEAGGLVERACANLAARYAVSYHPLVAEPESLAVRIYGSGGWGEAQLRLAK